MRVDWYITLSNPLQIYLGKNIGYQDSSSMSRHYYMKSIICHHNLHNFLLHKNTISNLHMQDCVCKWSRTRWQGSEYLCRRWSGLGVWCSWVESYHSGCSEWSSSKRYVLFDIMRYLILKIYYVLQIDIVRNLCQRRMEAMPFFVLVMIKPAIVPPIKRVHSNL